MSDIPLNIRHHEYNELSVTGDFVFLKSDRERPPLTRIDKLWTTPRYVLL